MSWGRLFNERAYVRRQIDASKEIGVRTIPSKQMGTGKPWYRLPCEMRDLERLAGFLRKLLPEFEFTVYMPDRVHASIQMPEGEVTFASSITFEKVSVELTDEDIAIAAEHYRNYVTREFEDYIWSEHRK